jgi:hypothetical protein
MGVGFLAVGFVGTLLSWVLLIWFGRRAIYNFGLACLVVLLLIIAILDCAPHYLSRPALSWTQAALLLVWNFCYDFSVGPVCFVILCEVSATKVRSKTIAVATAVQAALGIVMTIAIPYLINPDQANARGKVGFFFGGLAAISLVWAYFRVPETKGTDLTGKKISFSKTLADSATLIGRTYEELDIMFAKGVRTKDFKNYQVEGVRP